MKKILAFGNPLLDTIVLLNEDTLLKKYDLEPDGQKEVPSDQMALLKNDIKEHEKTVAPGGCAQNTLKVIQWLYNRQCLATIFGSVGADDEGELLAQILKQHKVDTNYIKHENYSTGTSVALVLGQSRSLVAHLGAAEVMSLHHVQSNSHLLEQIHDSNLMYMEGFFLTKRLEVATFILNHANSLNKVFAFNLSGQYLCEQYSETVTHFIINSTIIFGNRREFETLTANVEDFIRNLSEQGKVVLVTDGPLLILGAQDGEVHQFQVPGLKSEDIVDTTGAGDSFVAGFLVGYLQEKSLEECVELGCYAAHEIIKRSGCTVPECPPTVKI